MNQEEYVESIPDRVVSPIAQKTARDLISSLSGPTRLRLVSRQIQEGDRLAYLQLPIATALDDMDRRTRFTPRRLAFKLNRQLGLHALEALRHSSPVTGLVAAARVITREN